MPILLKSIARHAFALHNLLFVFANLCHVHVTGSFYFVEGEILWRNFKSLFYVSSYLASILTSEVQFLVKFYAFILAY